MNREEINRLITDAVEDFEIYQNNCSENGEQCFTDDFLKHWFEENTESLSQAPK